MAQNFDKYTGKKVVVVRTVSGQTEAEEIEGTCEVGNELGLLVKPKGKTQLELIDAESVVEVRYAEESVKKLARKTLKVVEFGQARSHLLERHGWTLAQVNGISEKEALDAHEQIDHEANDLGHVHGDKKATARAQAVENAEPEAAESVA